MNAKYQITTYCHHILEEYIQEGDVCIDATAGNGNDTVFLCEKVGKMGKVYAFDIQKQALEQTKQSLEEHGYLDRAKLILDGHQNMPDYVETEVSTIIFNFGYLPGGDHSIATKCDTSLSAIEKGLKLLKKGGVMNLCVYSGKETGYEEKEAILSYLKTLDSKKWLVIVHDFFNRRNDPPLPVFIIRLR